MSMSQSHQHHCWPLPCQVQMFQGHSPASPGRPGGAPCPLQDRKRSTVTPPPPGSGRAAQQRAQGQRKKMEREKAPCGSSCVPRVLQVPRDPTPSLRSVSRNQAPGECPLPPDGPATPGDTVTQNPSPDGSGPASPPPPGPQRPLLSPSPPPRPESVPLPSQGPPPRPLRVRRASTPTHHAGPGPPERPWLKGHQQTPGPALRPQPTALLEPLQAEPPPTPTAAAALTPPGEHLLTRGEMRVEVGEAGGEQSLMRHCFSPLAPQTGPLTPRHSLAHAALQNSASVGFHALPLPGPMNTAPTAHPF